MSFRRQGNNLLYYVLIVRVSGCDNAVCLVAVFLAPVCVLCRLQVLLSDGPYALIQLISLGT